MVQTAIMVAILFSALTISGRARASAVTDSSAAKKDSVWLMAGLSLDGAVPQLDPGTENMLGYSLWAGASWGRNVVAFDSHNDRSSAPLRPEMSRTSLALSYGWLKRDREAFLGARMGPSMLITGTNASDGPTPGVSAFAFVYLTPWVHWGLVGVELFGSYYGKQSFWGAKVSVVEINILLLSR